MPSPRSSASVIASKTQLTTSSARDFVSAPRLAMKSMSSLFVMSLLPAQSDARTLETKRSTPFVSRRRRANLALTVAYIERIERERVFFAASSAHELELDSPFSLGQTHPLET